MATKKKKKRRSKKRLAQSDARQPIAGFSRVQAKMTLHQTVQQLSTHIEYERWSEAEPLARQLYDVILNLSTTKLRLDELTIVAKPAKVNHAPKKQFEKFTHLSETKP